MSNNNRVKIVFAYDGSKYYGSQRQDNQKGVINEIELLFKALNIYSNIVPSSRTDRGVHSTNQVLHIDLPTFWNDYDKLKNIMNKKLPNSIYIKNIKRCENNFHSRFSAKKRVYRYIINSKNPNPFESDYSLFVDNFDLEVVNMAMQELIGIHNFKYFQKDDKNRLGGTIREIYKAKCYKYKNYYILYFEGNSFLRNQIRLLVGFLIKISNRELSIEDLKSQLNINRLIYKKPILPNGLYLTRIKY